MSDMTEGFNLMRAESGNRRAHNRTAGPKMLRAAGITDFDVRNDGAHIIFWRDPRIDFWPGTGRWKIDGDAKPRFGVDSLIAWLKQPAQAPKPRNAPKGYPCYGVMRQRPDEAGGEEFFHYAMWHGDTTLGPGERMVKGRFVPDES